jgi:hypothetical protein
MQVERLKGTGSGGMKGSFAQNASRYARKLVMNAGEESKGDFTVRVCRSLAGCNITLPADDSLLCLINFS